MTQPIWVPFLSAGTGALIGGLIGALIAFIIQIRAFNEARRQNDAGRLEEQKTSALTLLIKLYRMVSNLSMLSELLDKQPGRATTDDNNQQLEVPAAVVNLPNRVHFEPDELSALLRLDAHLFSELGTFDDEHNGILDVLALQRTERVSLENVLANEMKGRTLETLTSKEQQRIQSTITNLKFLAQGAADRSRTAKKSGTEHALKLQQLLKEKFGIAPYFMRGPTAT